MVSFLQARDAIVAAHRRFHTRALASLFPTLPANERAFALAREQRMGQSYIVNASRRLGEGIRRITADPTLTSPERDQRGRMLVSNEQRYLGQHLRETARRMQREAELHRLVEAGERYGFWVLSPHVQRHTPDCLAMGNRLWSMDVLRRVNPANRHGGCECRIVSEADARRMGHPIIRGYISAGVRAAALQEAEWEAPRWWPAPLHVRLALAELREAQARVPVRPGAAGGDPFKRDQKGRFATIESRLHRSLAPHLGRYNAAVARGNPDEMDARYHELRQAAEKVRGVARDESIRTIDHMHRIAIDPSGARGIYGTSVNIAGRAVRRRLSPRQFEGIPGGWADGRFRWLIPKDVLSDEQVARYKRGKNFAVTSSPEGAIFTTHSRIRPELAHALAVTFEGQHPELRLQRIKDRGVALGDDRPLDLPASLAPAMGRHDMSRYPHVSRRMLGDAGQATLPEVANRARVLGIATDARESEFSIGVPNRQGALDWQIGQLGIEVKAVSWRGVLPGIADVRKGKSGGATIKPKYRETKLARCAALGHLQPTLAVPMVDLDDNVEHVFVYRYPGHWEGEKWIPAPKLDAAGKQRVDKRTGKLMVNDAFAPLRLPAPMIAELAAGELNPGDARSPQGGREGEWVYLGTFGLRYNPMRIPGREQERVGVSTGRELTPAQGAAITRMPVAPADVDVAPKAPRPRAAVGARQKARDLRAAEQDRKVQQAIRMIGQGIPQGQVGAELGVSATTVNDWLKKHAPHLRPGPGARIDLKRHEQKPGAGRQRPRLPGADAQ